MHTWGHPQSGCCIHISGYPVHSLHLIDMVYVANFTGFYLMWLEKNLVQISTKPSCSFLANVLKRSKDSFDLKCILVLTMHEFHLIFLVISKEPRI